MQGFAVSFKMCYVFPLHCIVIFINTGRESLRPHSHGQLHVYKVMTGLEESPSLHVSAQPAVTCCQEQMSKPGCICLEVKVVHPSPATGNSWLCGYKQWLPSACHYFVQAEQPLLFAFTYYPSHNVPLILADGIWCMHVITHDKEAL